MLIRVVHTIIVTIGLKRVRCNECNYRKAYIVTVYVLLMFGVTYGMAIARMPEVVVVSY
jgi:hypothetical protein